MPSKGKKGKTIYIMDMHINKTEYLNLTISAAVMFLIAYVIREIQTW